ncbi:TetR/AcrR family transcriptional regulator [Subtercola endophyticus]|uniref:TetR/AcrR family transcriptional regulator n=1 Tax=Subtercola endophyticus TaxID=2895559 RepID=UPI001E3FB005|nr:TetR/AcrR family transcriptional regulator [Subtercola endophyticus]UFS58854.1 TetR/AcrR family transcriptional regulator [Subtercola endophyticus]
MAADTRRRMVEGAARLLAQRGLQETSFSGVLELTGAPRGSIYHHFPDGKDQLVAEAVELAGAHAVALLSSAPGTSPVDITAHFVNMWRHVLVRSQYTAGCSVLAVTVATDSPDLLSHTANVFRAWRLRLTELLVSGGLEQLAASRFAALLIASTEGAVVLSRAEQTLEPFELVAEQLLAQAAALEA